MTKPKAESIGGFYRYTGAPHLAPGMPARDLTPEDYDAELARLPEALQPVAAKLYTHLKTGKAAPLEAPDEPIDAADAVAPEAVVAAPVEEGTA